MSTGNGTRFRPGQSGNPGGRPKVIREIQELAQEHTEDAIKTLVAIMDDDAASPAARVSAASAILDRGYGKPPQFTQLQAIKPDKRDATDWTTAELQAFLNEEVVPARLRTVREQSQ